MRKRISRDRQRQMRTGPALDRLFGDRKHRPCAYCGKKLARQQATFDHVRPLAAGGYDKTKNGVIACRACNAAKGCKSVEQFRAERAERVK